MISGVNAGANLGVDLLVSGTFAAAREAAIERLPAMAVSHYRRLDVPATWHHVPRWLAATLDEFAEYATGHENVAGKPATQVWNVNLPAVDPELSDIPPRVSCPVDSRPLQRTARRHQSEVTFVSDFHGRPRDAETDVARCFAGAITISKVAPHFG